MPATQRGAADEGGRPIVTSAPFVPPRARPAPQLRLGRRSYAVLLPSWRDPRLHLASVIVTLQVLGQTVLDFDLSVAQILTAVGTCAGLEIVIQAHRQGVVAWPASALLTGNGVAFILRVPGTRHGDWWSTRGLWIFAATAAVSLLSKYIVRFRGEQLFNPSNIGLVVCFLALGVSRADPQDLWWGPMSWGLALTFAVIIAGGLTLSARLRLGGMAAAFWFTFAAGVAVLAWSGHCMTARWHIGAVCGWSFWWVLVTSPEVLVFLFFMITDPRTAPRGQVGRLLYGALVGFVAVVLVAPQRTEFATKVAILAALALVTAVRPLIDRLSPIPGTAEDTVGGWLGRVVGVGAGPAGAAVGGPGARRTRSPRSARWRPAVLGCVLALGGAVIVAAGAGARPEREATPPPPLVDAGGPARPVLAPDAAPRPAVTIAAEVRQLAPAFSAQEADRLAREVVDDLLIVAEALRRGEPELAATAATGAELERVRRLAAENRRAGVVLDLGYTFDAVEIVLARVGPQAAPEIAVSVRGRLQRTTVDEGPPPTVLSREESVLDRTLLVTLVGPHHLLADEHLRR